MIRPIPESWAVMLREPSFTSILHAHRMRRDPDRESLDRWKELQSTRPINIAGELTYTYVIRLDNYVHSLVPWMKGKKTGECWRNGY
jgi:hypothetical protein